MAGAKAPRPKAPAKAPGGRPSKYKPECVEQARKLMELGATDEEVANFFEVHVATLYRWQAAHPEFCEALKVGKVAADNRVERSLYHRAVGYTYDSEKVFQFQGQIVRAKTREHIPPSEVAAIFWLKNRRPDDWRANPDKGDPDAGETISIEDETDDG